MIVYARAGGGGGAPGWPKLDGGGRAAGWPKLGGGGRAAGRTRILLRDWTEAIVGGLRRGGSVGRAVTRAWAGAGGRTEAGGRT